MTVMNEVAGRIKRIMLSFLKSKAKVNKLIYKIIVLFVTILTSLARASSGPVQVKRVYRFSSSGEKPNHS